VIEDKKTSELSDSDSDSDREIAVAEARKQSELEPGMKQRTGGWPVKI
jgi:hypothetical protein